MCVPNVCVCVYVYYRIIEQYLATKNEDMHFSTNWMQLETLMFSEICQSHKDKYYVISLTLVANTKHKN